MNGRLMKTSQHCLRRGGVGQVAADALLGISSARKLCRKLQRRSNYRLQMITAGGEVDGWQHWMNYAVLLRRWRNIGACRDFYRLPEHLSSHFSHLDSLCDGLCITSAKAKRAQPNTCDHLYGFLVSQMRQNGRGH
jgi:hypothetical protein